MPKMPNSRTLNDGTVVPLLAFGVVHNGRDSTPEILRALQKGFRHYDTARLYGNEQCVGQAIAQWEGGTREDIFIQGKWGESEDKAYEHDPERSLMKSLELLGTDYIDLYLIHNLQYLHPLTLAEAWAKMEDSLAPGLVKSIGLSAVPAEQIEELSKVWKIKPSVNQVEYHPYLFSLPRTRQMMDTCKKYDIAVEPFTALAPLTRWPGGLAQKAAENIAAVKGISAPQVLLVWARQMTGGPVITKEKQYQEILDTAEVILTEDEMEIISTAGREAPQKRRYSIHVWNDVDGEGSAR